MIGLLTVNRPKSAIERKRMADDGENKDIEIYGPAGTKLRARGYDTMTILVVAGLAFFGYMFFTSLARIELLMQRYGQKQSEMLCLLILPLDERVKQLGDPNSLCKRYAKMDYDS